MTPTHTCEDSTATTAIASHLENNPEVWENIPWTCSACNLNNHGTREHCCRTGCSGPGSSRKEVLQGVLAKMAEEMSLLSEAASISTELWSIQLVTEVLFSPHNKWNCGLLEDAFNIPTDTENICACVEAMGLRRSSTPESEAPATSIPSPPHTQSPQPILYQL